MTLAIGLAALVTACGGTTTPSTEDPAAKVAAEAAKETREAAAAEAEAEAAAAREAAAPMSIADLMAAKAEKMGQTVTIAALYASHEAKDELTHVTLVASAEEGAATLLCAMVDGSGLDGMEANAEVNVQGTLTDQDGVAVLQDCTKAGDGEAAVDAEAPEDEAAPE